MYNIQSDSLQFIFCLMLRHGKYQLPCRWSCRKKVHSSANTKENHENWLIANKILHHPKHMLRTKILEPLYKQYLNPFSEYLSGGKKSFIYFQQHIPWMNSTKHLLTLFCEQIFITGEWLLCSLYISMCGFYFSGNL